MLFVLSSLFVLAASVLVVASFRIDRFAHWAVAVWLFWTVLISLEARGLSLLGLVASRPAWIVADLLGVLVARAVWRRRGRPSVFPPVSIDATRDVFADRWLRPALVGITLVAAALHTVLLAATLVVPQNLDDVVTAYLARVGYWIQHGDLGPYAASAYNSVQSSYPRNAQLPVLRSVVLLGNDRLAGIEQWLAVPLGALALYGLARAIGARRGPAWLCGVTWTLVPTVAVQSGVALTDLVSVNLLLAVLMFGVTGWREQRPSLLALSSVSFAMFVGTKQIATFVAPGLLVLLLVALLWGRGRRRAWWTWMAATVPVLLVLGLVDYLRNWRYYGNPLGDPDSFELFAVKATTSQRVSAISTNFRKAFVDSWFGDLPVWIANRLPGFSRVQAYDPRVGTGYYLDGSQAWAGLFVCGLITVGLVFAAYQLVRYRRGLALLVAVPAALYVVSFFWTRINYTAAFSRYLLVPVALLLPAAAVGLSAVRIEWRAGRALLAAVALAVVTGLGVQGVHAGLRSGHRPLWGPQTVWGEDRVALLGRSTGFSDRHLLVRAFQYLDRCHPGARSLALIAPNKFPQSLLFGPAYSRRVEQFSTPFPTVVDDRFLQDRKVAYALVQTSLLDEIAVGGPTTRVVTFGPITVVARRSDTDLTC